MIRNLRKFGDDEKQLMLLKEQLQLAIKNDEAIAQSRQNFQKDIPPEIDQSDNRTLAEQIADDDSQRVMAQNFLSQIFKNEQVLDILGNLNKEQIIGINSLWSGIKTELKGVNVKAMLPKDFITFLNKYMETAVSLQGALNVSINTIEELKQLLPTAELMKRVDELLKKTNAPDIIKARSTELAKALPTEQNYETIDALPAMQKKQKILELVNSDLPNQVLLRRSVDEETVGNLEKLLRSVTPAKITDVKDILSSLSASRAVPDVRSRMAPVAITLGRTLVSSKDKESDKKVVKDFEDEISKINQAILERLDGRLKLEIVKRVRDPSYPLSDRAEAEYENLIAQNIGAVLDYLNSKSVNTEGRQFLRKRLEAFGFFDDQKRDSRTYRFIGKGIKMGRGRPPSYKPKAVYKLRIGEGIKVKREPVNVEFGKYILNTNQLKKQVLHVKNRAGGSLSWFQPIAMSDAFTELINDMLQTNSVNKHLLKTLDSDEQKVFYELCDRAGLLKEFKMVRPVDNEEKELENKFQILLGEYQAGNNSPLLIQQLRKHVIYFANKGKIPKQKAYAMLTQLS